MSITISKDTYWDRIHSDVWSASSEVSV